MNQSEDDEALAQRLREHLRASETLDPVVRARLSAARARALEPAHSKSWAWLGAGGLLAASLLAALLVPQFIAQKEQAPDLAQAEAFEWMFDDDTAADPEFYEDIEVLTWLVTGDERA